MDVRPLNVLALCAGAGTLELGVHLATGGRTRVVCSVERNAFAAATLVARMEDEALDQAPIWDDLCTFDGRPWRGVVDLVTAGFPCQPNSAAGRRLGTDDERWLWPDVARIVGDVGPDLVFLENVPGIATERGGIGDVQGSLAALGFDAEWSLHSASEAGAPHERDRWWCLAYRHGSRLPVVGGHVRQVSDPQPRCDAHRSGSQDLVHADSGGGNQRTGSAHHEGHGAEPANPGEGLADPDCEGWQGCLHGTSGRWEGPSGRGGLPLFPPGPDDLDDWRAVLDRAPCLEPSLRRVADGLAHRVDRLHTVGNGVVPLVVALAIIGLARRAGIAYEPEDSGMTCGQRTASRTGSSS